MGNGLPLTLFAGYVALRTTFVLWMTQHIYMHRILRNHGGGNPRTPYHAIKANRRKAFEKLFVRCLPFYLFAQYSFTPLKLNVTATSLTWVAFLLFCSLSTTPRDNCPGAHTSSRAEQSLYTSFEKVLSL